MLAAMFHFTIATHYCQGIEVATKVSLTGKLADCGMGNPKNEIPLSETILSRLCCDNNLNYCGVFANYVTTFSFVPQIFQNDIQIFAIPAKYSSTFPSGLIPLNTDTSPPGTVRSTDVDLSGICVFRI